MRLFKSILATLIILVVIINALVALFPAKESKEFGMAELDQYVIKKSAIEKPKALSMALVTHKSITYGDIVLESIEEVEASESKANISRAAKRIVLAIEEPLSEEEEINQEPKPELMSESEPEPEPTSEPEPEPTLVESEPEPAPEPEKASNCYTVSYDVNKSLDELIEELANNSSLTVDDIIKLIKTYHGECDCVVSMAERSMVIWVILNRLDAGGFGKTVAEICTRPYQFTGYSANNPITERGFALVSDVVMRWEREKAGETDVGRTIPKDILFFHADSIPSRGEWHNAFYKYSEGNSGYKIYFDRNNPIENPYES
ncbi:cell wall hydrolase [Candidatus Saccharibacteria bacterium]|nr:cell wall hydrolase [Candidatus Saccharibacteria bacterium]